MPGIAIANKIDCRGKAWNIPTYILMSGAIWYKREISDVEFTLSYSSNAGATWDLLMTLDITEDSVIIDLTHQYIHSIVGTSYHVTYEGELLYNT